MTEQPQYLTKARLEELKKELDELKNVKRKEVAKKIEQALEMGDLSENAAYSDAKEEQAFLEGRILELVDLINNAVIINGNQTNNSVKVGSQIIVQCEGIGEKKYTIVGPTESNPLKGLISNESPLGQAFLGRKVKDEVEIIIPRGKTKCKILKII